MTQTAWLAAAGLFLFVAACAAFFFVGRRIGRIGETARQARAKSSAEETAKRVLDDAARDAESLRKTAVLSGKEELIRLREDWEQEARKSREEGEREGRRNIDLGLGRFRFTVRLLWFFVLSRWLRNDLEPRERAATLAGRARSPTCSCTSRCAGSCRPRRRTR